jgi:hypothetical protein
MRIKGGCNQHPGKSGKCFPPDFLLLTAKRINRKYEIFQNFTWQFPEKMVRDEISIDIERFLPSGRSRSRLKQN